MSASKFAAKVLPPLAMSNSSKRQASDLKLPGIDDELDKKASFEAAKKKFAMYGKQNDHVDHLLTSNRSGTVDSSLSIKNTHLLQENGEVAAQLDDLNYHLDGILGAKLHLKVIESIDHTPTKPLSIEEEHLFGHANSILDLAGLLQNVQLQSMICIGDETMNYAERITRVVLLLKTVQHEFLKLALGVFVFFLSSSSELQTYLDDKTIIAILSCMRKEIELPIPVVQSSKEFVEKDKTNIKSNSTTKKIALKRKQNSSRRSSMSGIVGETKMNHHHNKIVTFAFKNQEILTRVADLLKKQDVFCLDKKVQVNLMDILTMTLHNCLQIDGQQNTTPLNSGATTPNENGIIFSNSKNNATETFQRVLQRKKLLTTSGGLNLLTHLVKIRFKSLKEKYFSQLAKPTTFDCILAFHHIRIQLKVLDQASFFASEVQETLSKDKQLFDLLLQLIEILSDVAWGGTKAKKKWQSDQHFMELIVEVLFVSNRVLINLTHHNEQASQYLYQLNGTKILFLAFCKLWNMVENHSSIGDRNYLHHEKEKEKFFFDAFLLLLSALTNCVEYSQENRQALTKICLLNEAKEEKQKKKTCCLENYQFSNVCTLLVSFFLNQIKSYENQLHKYLKEEEKEEEEEEDWIPEDVILGGCCSLLLGCLMKDSSYHSAVILGALPNGSPELLLRALSAFVALHSQLGALTPEVGKSVLEVEKVLKTFLPGSDFDSKLGRLEEDEKQKTKNNTNTSPVTLRGRLPTLTSTSFDFTSPSPTSSPCLLTKARLEQIRKTKQEEALESKGVFSGTPPAGAFKFKSSKRVCVDGGVSDVENPLLFNDRSNSSNNRKTKKKRPCGNLERAFDKVMEEQSGKKKPQPKQETATSRTGIVFSSNLKNTKRQVQMVQVTSEEDPFDCQLSDKEQQTRLRKKTSVLSSKKSTLSSDSNSIQTVTSTSPQKNILNRKKKKNNKSPLKSIASTRSSNGGNVDVFDFDG